jgi:2-polyprenyl-6-methoxyphenol hydroxylase-like FAD-dependent oxidoreductase
MLATAAPQWSRPGLVLVGDAAHTLTPILGQGVNHVLIDGVTLAELVDSALSPSPSMAAAQPMAAAHRSPAAAPDPR